MEYNYILSRNGDNTFFDLPDGQRVQNIQIKE